jgi:hypothetical protein
MDAPTKTGSSVFLRLMALLLHAVLNFIVITWFTNFDLTGSWLVFTGFVVAVFALIYFFLKHIVSFLHFVKNR